MSRPLVTVVIPSYNAERYLADAVRSSLAQTYDAIEVIVVDDGSMTSQAAALECIHDSRLRVVRQGNAGVASARNRGVREGRGELIALLDADDRWLPTKLEVQCRIMQAQSAAVAFSDVYVLRDGVRLPKTYHEHSAAPTAAHCFRPLLRRNFVPLSSALLTRQAFDSVDGFCEDRSIWLTADWDLWLRLAKQWRFAYVPEALAEYRLHHTNGSGDVEALTEHALRTLVRLQAIDPTVFDECAKDLRHSRGDLWFNLGYARLRQGRVVEARAALWQAARLRPWHLGTWKDILRAAFSGSGPKQSFAS